MMNDIKKATMPVAFLSGDIHMSEIVRAPQELMGYQSYEVTSSPIHSYIFRSKSGGKGLLNPGRMVSHKDHNYILIESEVIGKTLSFKSSSYGVTQEAPFFTKELTVKK